MSKKWVVVLSDGTTWEVVSPVGTVLTSTKLAARGSGPSLRRRGLSQAIQYTCVGLDFFTRLQVLS